MLPQKWKICKLVFLQYLSSRQSKFQSEIKMRLALTIRFTVILLAVFSQASVLQKTDSSFERETRNKYDGLQQTGKDLPFNLTFQCFKAKYNKKYTTLAEQNYREHIFSSNLKRLNYHNKDPLRTYLMKPNSFLDININQFKSIYTSTYQSNRNSWNISNQLINNKRDKTDKQSSVTADYQLQNDQAIEQYQEKSKQINNQDINGQRQNDGIRNLQTQKLLPLENKKIIVKNTTNIIKISNSNVTSKKVYQNINIDWSMYSGKVKFQGTCGACYAFSAVDTFSAVSAISKFGFIVPFSIQQVIDCTKNGLTFGCKGGYLQGSFTEIQMNGITLESAYPYTSQYKSQAGSCQLKGGPFKISSFSQIEKENCDQVIKELSYGPVAAGISGYNLQYYGSGVFNDCSDVLDHAIMIVGYQRGRGWKIKNSWGVQWGENGFAWIEEGNTCGICNMAVAIRV